MNLTSEEFWQNLGFSTCVIRDDKQDPYLLRIYLTPHRDWWRALLPGLFLHHFYRSDHDREVHSHPWIRALSFILSGGYLEERLEGGKIVTYHRKRFTFNCLDKNTFHRVQLFDEARGCWSLFLAGEKHQDWGFMSRDGRTFELWWVRDIRIFTENTVAALQSEGWHYGQYDHVRQRLENQFEVKRLQGLLMNHYSALQRCRSRLLGLVNEHKHTAPLSGPPYRFGELISRDHLEALMLIVGLGQVAVHNDQQLMQALLGCGVPILSRFARGA